MESLGIHEPGAYVDLLSRDSEEKILFQSLLSVTITRFFRNAWLWSELADLLSDEGNSYMVDGQALALWSAGCGGGEEAFTAAMLLDDLTRSRRLNRSWTVLGTDIDAASLERSVELHFRRGSIREVPERMRNRWFSEEMGVWTLNRNILQLVDIGRHDFVRDEPPGIFHTVLLRNSALTYNTDEIQREVLRKIHGCLLQPGLLVIGRTERMPEGKGFEEISRCIYRKV